MAVLLEYVIFSSPVNRTQNTGYIDVECNATSFRTIDLERLTAFRAWRVSIVCSSATTRTCSTCVIVECLSISLHVQRYFLRMLLTTA